MWTGEADWRREQILRRNYKSMTIGALVQLVNTNAPIVFSNNDTERYREMNVALQELQMRHINQDPSPDCWAEILGISRRHPQCEGLAEFQGRFERQLGGVWQMLECFHAPKFATLEEGVREQDSGHWFVGVCR